MNALTRALLRLGAVMFVGLFIVVALFLSMPATPAHAQETTPNVAVIDRTVDLATTTAWITVPVTLTTGSTQVSAVGFVLDYDQSCVRIDDVETDVTGLPDSNKFMTRRVNDADNGKLEIAVWAFKNFPLDALPTGNLMEVKFALENACRTGADDRDIDFGFTVEPATTFGDTEGSAVAGAAYTGTYTLNINLNPTEIGFTPGTVDENVSGDREIGTLSATDTDGDTHTFALATGCEDSYTNDGFSIAPGAATKLRTNRTFNYEAVPSYTLCIQANDGRGGIYVDTIEVSVVNVNDAPTFLSLDGNTLLEGSAAGTTIGTFHTDDEDTVDSFVYEFAAGGVDNDDFAIAGSVLKAASEITYNYALTPTYKIRVKSTDIGTQSVEQAFTVRIVGKSVLLLPDEPEVPFVVATGFVTVPIRYNAMGNDVVTATFAVSYTDTCLTYKGLSGLQSGFGHVGDPDDDEDSPVEISIASSTSVLREGVIGYLSFEGGACGANDIGAWTDLEFGTTTLQAAGDAAVTSTTSDGKLIVIPNDELGDCNSDGDLNAGDFTAIALESFDQASELTTSSSPIKLADKSWLWSPLGDFKGSAKGCDANVDRILDVADITCAARTFFGARCTAEPDGRRSQAAQIAAPASVVAAPGSTVAAPIILTANGNAVAAAAFTMQIDPALVFDPADADEDGVPDAVSFNTPAGFFKMVLYDAPTRRLQVLVTGLTMPLPVLPDGAFATVHLQGAASANGGAAPINLNDVSLGSVEGNQVEVIVAPIGLLNRVFLPAVER